MEGKGNSFAVVGTHALGVALQQALGRGQNLHCKCDRHICRVFMFQQPVARVCCGEQTPHSSWLWFAGPDKDGSALQHAATIADGATVAPITCKSIQADKTANPTNCKCISDCTRHSTLQATASIDAAAAPAGLAVMYVADAVRASGEQQGAWQRPQHVQSD